MQSFLRGSIPRGPARFLGTALASLVIVLFLFGSRQQNAREVAQEHLPKWLGGHNTWSGGKAKGPGTPYYTYETQSYFPPIKSEVDGGERDLCANFPVHALDDIQVVLKTGSGDHKRLDAQLATVSSCIKNLIIVSDLNEQRGDHHLIDIIADLPESYTKDNGDFDAYERQKETIRKGQTVDKSGAGWKLDKYKFIPMVEKAYEMRPNAQWYVFIETDTYLFWDTLFRLLEQYKPTDPIYLGAPVAGADHLYFGYGGAGFVLSKELVSQFVGSKGDVNGSQMATNVTEQYADEVRRDCCGDSALAGAILDKTGVRMQRLWPVFNGDEYVKLQVDTYNWCTPLIAMHHLKPAQMKEVWQWERTRPDDGQPILHSTLLFGRQHDLLSDIPRKYWDNECDRNLPREHPAHKTLEACQKECTADAECFQYSYIAHVCRFKNGITYGHETMREKQYACGWDSKKVLELGFRNATTITTGCDNVLWTYPQTH